MHIKESGIKNSEEVEEEQHVSVDLSSYPRLKFINGYQNIDNYEPVSINVQEAQGLADLVVGLKISDFYEKSFINTQGFCFFNENESREIKDKCRSLLGLYDLVNEHITTVQADESAVELLGLQLDGAIVTLNTVSQDDPHHNMYVEAQENLGRNSILSKGHVVFLESSESAVEISDIICQVSQHKSLNISLSALELSVVILEEAFVNKDTLLADKKIIYCTLSAYYEENGMMEKLIEFLLLNIPDGEIRCL